MSYGIICRQKGCRNYAEYRFTWPGRDESFICEKHKDSALGIAGGMGFSLQMIPLTLEEHRGNEGMKSLEEQGK